MIYIILIVTVLVLLLILTIVLLKKQSKKKKLLKYFEDEYLKILRVDALDRAIINNGAGNTGPRKILVKIHETSELVDKTYLIDMENPWFIGRKPGPNTICIRGDKTISSIHCSLQVQSDRVFLVDMGSKNLTYYQPVRGAKQAWHLPQRGAQMLTTGDRFYVGYTCFEVIIYDSNYGII